MKKKILSVLLCLCMVMALLPTTALATEVPTDIGDVQANSAATLKSKLETEYQVATVTTEGSTVRITLTKDIIGRILFGYYGYSFDTPNVIIDTAGHTISGGTQNEALCLNHNSNVTVELIGGGTFTSGRNYAVYVGIGTTLVIKDASLGPTQKEGGTIKTNGSSTYNVKINSGAATEYTGEQTLSDDSFGSIVVQPGPAAKKVVTFNANGHGTAPGSQQVTSGQKVTEPTAPTADGYTFGGWYKEVGCTTPWVFNTDTVNSDITLYAKWTATSSATLEQTNFTHAYDIQRSPAFPTKNQTITLSGLYYPILSDGTRGSQNTGSWKLIKAGTYSYMKSISANSANLDAIVTSVVTNYTSLNSDAVVIYELKDGDTHIAYGVVIAYDSANGNAVFLGDSLYGGAGYLLATGERSGTIYATASRVATDDVQIATYGISLDVDENDVYTFDPVTEGYAAPAPKFVTVTNTGNQPTGELTVSLSGGSSFELSRTTIGSITDTNGTATFTVAPKSNLSAATYTDTVIVSGANIVSKAFHVKITVNPMGTYTVTFNANGHGTAPAPQTVADGTNVSEPAAPTANGYTFGGWYTDAACTSAWNFATPVTANITLYARWTYTGGSSSSSGGSYTPPTYKVESEVSKDTDGSVSLSKSNAKKGDTVTITVTPDRYYKVDGVTVKDKNGKEIAVTDNGDGTFTFKMPDSKVTVEPLFSWDNPFADVAEDAYYAPAVEWALKNDVTNGTGDGTTFSPNVSCTRAQIVTFLWRAANCPEPTGTQKFDDVAAGSYYEKAVAWATENGITGGTGNGLFSPDAICTRAQAVTFIFRSMGLVASNSDIEFEDVAPDAYYADAVAWATENGITDGVGNNLFAPDNNCTRAQIITFLYRNSGDSKK